MSIGVYWEILLVQLVSAGPRIELVVEERNGGLEKRRQEQGENCDAIWAESCGEVLLQHKSRNRLVDREG